MLDETQCRLDMVSDGARKSSLLTYVACAEILLGSLLTHLKATNTIRLHMAFAVVIVRVRRDDVPSVEHEFQIYALGLIHACRSV